MSKPGSMGNFNRTRVLSEVYLTTKDMAKIFGRKPLTLYHWRKQRGLPHIQVSDSSKSDVLYNPDEIIEWANEEDEEILDPEPIDRVVKRRRELDLI